MFSTSNIIQTFSTFKDLCSFSLFDATLFLYFKIKEVINTNKLHLFLTTLHVLKLF